MAPFYPMNDESPRWQSSSHHTILLRYWREDETVVWRYVAQDLATGEEYSFASVDLLLAFLYQHIERQVR